MNRLLWIICAGAILASCASARKELPIREQPRYKIQIVDVNGLPVRDAMVWPYVVGCEDKVVYGSLASNSLGIYTVRVPFTMKARKDYFYIQKPGHYPIVLPFRDSMVSDTARVELVRNPEIKFHPRAVPFYRYPDEIKSEVKAAMQKAKQEGYFKE